MKRTLPLLGLTALLWAASEHGERFRVSEIKIVATDGTTKKMRRLCVSSFHRRALARRSACGRKRTR